jgi:hypothetical protein
MRRRPRGLQIIFAIKCAAAIIAPRCVNPFGGRRERPLLIERIKGVSVRLGEIQTSESNRRTLEF